MREIKFRAWDGKEMHLPEYSDKEDFHLLADGTIVETHEYGYERHEMTSVRNGWMVMQYTGMKDKNRKDIYEGDITKIQFDFKEEDLAEGDSLEELNSPLIIQVIFYKGCFGLMLPNLVKGSEGDFTPLYEYFDELLGGDEIEVIGNIYENPDLLI